MELLNKPHTWSCQILWLKLIAKILTYESITNLIFSSNINQRRGDFNLILSKSRITISKGLFSPANSDSTLFFTSWEMSTEPQYLLLGMQLDCT